GAGVSTSGLACPRARHRASRHAGRAACRRPGRGRQNKQLQSDRLGAARDDDEGRGHRRQLRTRRHHGHSGPGGVPDADPSRCLQPTRERAGGGGTVGGLQAVTVNTDLESGCAHAAWRLGTTPGPNTLTAAALASGSPLTFTATATGSVAGKPLYVVNEVGNSITVYAAGASGNATPTATIAGGNTGLNDLWNI